MWTAGSRVLVQRWMHDEFVAAMVDASRSVTVGHVFDPSATLGPLVSQTQLDRVAGYVDLGRSEGVQVALDGGVTGDGGFFHEPVIFTDVPHEIGRAPVCTPVPNAHLECTPLLEKKNMITHTPN